MGVGETPEVNAHRELKEEMGIDIAEGDFKKLFVQVSHEGTWSCEGGIQNELACFSTSTRFWSCLLV